jgi:hypothetical protein
MIYQLHRELKEIPTPIHISDEFAEKSKVQSAIFRRFLVGQIEAVMAYFKTTVDDTEWHG